MLGASRLTPSTLKFGGRGARVHFVFLFGGLKLFFFSVAYETGHETGAGNWYMKLGHETGHETMGPGLDAFSNAGVLQGREAPGTHPPCVQGGRPGAVGHPPSRAVRVRNSSCLNLTNPLAK